MRKGILIGLALILVVGLVLAGCAKPAPAPTPAPKPEKPLRDPDPKMVTVATTPMPAGKYMLMAAITKILTQKTRPTALIGVGGGFVQAMTIVKGTADLSTPMSPTSYWVWSGTQVKQAIEQGPQPYLRKTMTTTIAPLHVMVEKDSPIKSLADLPRELWVMTGTDVELMLVKAIIKGYGLPEKEFKFNRMAYREKFTAFKDRKLNIFHGISSIPGSGIMDIATSMDVRFLSFDEDKLDKVIAENPLYEKVILPPGMYGKNQPDRVVTVAFTTDILTHDTLNEQLVYDQTKAILENLPAITKMFSGAKELGPERAVLSHLIPFHKGAIRYYKEIGVWTAAHEKRQQELLKK